MKNISVLLFLVLVGCSTTSNRSIQLFESKNVSVEKVAFEFTTIEVVENVYPPANKVCVEYYRIDSTNKQCTKFANWIDYVAKKYSKGKLIKLDYKYQEKLMILYIKVKE